MICENGPRIGTMEQPKHSKRFVFSPERLPDYWGNSTRAAVVVVVVVVELVAVAFGMMCIPCTQHASP